jgi:hypothetical protein
MNTSFWGPSGWRFLHIIANIYPDNPNMTDKIIMRDFMGLVANVLPCKYCRASFTKYSHSLDITPYLESNILMQEWLYRMHNKVNGKLRRQGFCTTENPSLESIIAKYDKLGKKTIMTLDNVEKKIAYLAEIGFDFLGSIVFNYQGYFVNCHTNEEKVNIISSYNKFFNMLPKIICTYMKQPLLDGKQFKIRSILQHNEPYTQLKRWFWKCELLATSKNWSMSYEDYETHFNRHIVNTCNTPAADKVKSCRKLSKKDITVRKYVLSKKK